MKQSFQPMLSSYYFCYDTSESNPSSYLFYNISLTETNTWLEIPQPNAPSCDRSSSSLVKTIKEQNLVSSSNDNIPEDESPSKRTTFNKSNIKHFQLKHKVKIPSLMNSPETTNQNKKSKVPIIEFKSFDIPYSKLKRDITNEELEENEKLVKEYEINKLKKEEKEKNEIEASKRQRIQQFNNALKKEFDSSKFTFDSHGKIIQMKRINYETLCENNTEFVKSKLIIKNPPNAISTQDIFKEKEIAEEEEVIKNDEFYSIENNDYQYLPKKISFRKNKFKLPPSGNNFDKINPEIGVRVIGEDNKRKDGSKDFNLKYNKTSIYDYSRLVNESMKYNDNMVKRGFISEQPISENNNQNINTNTNDIQSQPYYGYKDNIMSSNNPLIQNATNQIPLPHITSTNPELNSITPSYILTQNNPLMVHTTIANNSNNNSVVNTNVNLTTLRTRIYKGNSDEDQIHIKNMSSFKEFQKSIELYPNDYSINIKQYHNFNDVHNKKRSHMILKRNASDFGEMFKHPFKTNVLKKESSYEDVDEFNSNIIKNDTRQYLYYNIPRRSIDIFKRLPKGNKIKELGINIVNVKMPRERKFNLNQYNDSNQQRYAVIHKRKKSMGL